MYIEFYIDFILLFISIFHYISIYYGLLLMIYDIQNYKFSIFLISGIAIYFIGAIIILILATTEMIFLNYHRIERSIKNFIIKSIKLFIPGIPIHC
jgi:hypothetical protein